MFSVFLKKNLDIRGCTLEKLLATEVIWYAPRALGYYFIEQKVNK